MTDLIRHGSPFDAIRETDDRGEHWSARRLQPLLGYDQWRRFEDSIERALASIRNAAMDPADHVAASGKMVPIGSGAVRYIEDYRLTRYGAYVVAMNGDPRKPEVAAAQTYFAVRTHEAETAAPLSGPELIARAVIEAQAMLTAAHERIAELEPPAAAWSALADASGDWSLRDAAQVLDRDPAISTGQNRLAHYLREVGWIDKRGIPYQSRVDQGLIRSRVRSYDHPRTGERMLAEPQVRITAKGLARLHVLLGGREPLDTTERHLTAVPTQGGAA